MTFLDALEQFLIPKKWKLEDFGWILGAKCGLFPSFFFGTQILEVFFIFFVEKTQKAQNVKKCVSYWFLRYFVRVGMLKKKRGHLQKRDKKPLIFHRKSGQNRQEKRRKSS